MKIPDLVERLSREGVDPNAYDLDGEGKDETYCLERSEGAWMVFYRERDIHRGERRFSSEEEACAFFLERVLQDPTTRRRTGRPE